MMIYHPFTASKIAPEDANLPPGRVHHISVSADDGIQLYGWHVLADGRSAHNRDDCDRQLAKGGPLVLFFSGNAGNRCYRIPDLTTFTRLGVDVFLVDYRGYGENEGSPSEEMLAADARAVWNYTVERRKVVPNRIVLYGESLGGGVAVRLAAEMSEAGSPPGGLLLRSTFSSLTDTATYHYPWLPVRLLLVDRYPSAKRIGAVTCPLLLVHGRRDTIVPIEIGRKLFEAAPQKSSIGIEKRFVELPTTDHNDVLSTAGDEFQDAICQFLKTMNGK